MLFVLSAWAYGQDRGLAVVAKALGGEYAVSGRQVVAFIAVDAYGEWPSLKNPVKDAKEIKAILERRYYVDESIELYDAEATKAGILKLFERLSNELQPEDSLFIYYAGHGHLDTMSSTGFWIPSNAGVDKYEQKNWIPNVQVRNILSKLKARHVVLASDSCFSGDILDTSRGKSPEISAEYYRNAFSRVSRQVLSSGADETVPDASQFAAQLKLALEGNTKPYIDPLELYSQIRLGVTESLPLYGELKNSGQQEGGSFLFFLRDGAQPSAAAAPSAPLAPEAKPVPSTPAAAVAPVKEDDSFVGVGIVCTAIDEGIFISRVFPGGPADRAGIETGMIVTKVEGDSTKGMTSDAFSKRVRGEAGSDVELTVKQYQYSLPLPRAKKMMRERIQSLVFQARSGEGKAFEASVQNLRFFTGGDKAPAYGSREYGADFTHAPKGTKYIYTELSLGLPPEEQQRTIPLKITWQVGEKPYSVAHMSTVQGGWDNVVTYRGYSGKGLVRVEVSFNDRVIAKGAYIWE